MQIGARLGFVTPQPGSTCTECSPAESASRAAAEAPDSAGPVQSEAEAPTVAVATAESPSAEEALKGRELLTRVEPIVNVHRAMLSYQAVQSLAKEG